MAILVDFILMLVNNSYKKMKSKNVTFSVHRECFRTNYWKDIFRFQKPIIKREQRLFG